MEPAEFARLQAVEQAVKAELAKPGVVTRARLTTALAAQPVSTDPLSSNVEETL